MAFDKFDCASAGGAAMTTITIDTLAYFYNQGGRFCRPIGRSKEDMETGWTQKPYDLQAIVAHVNAGNNAGLLTGEKSANIGLFDLDRKYQAFCKKFPRFAAFPTVYRLDADDRAKFAFIVEDSVENISQLKSVKYKPFGETHPWFEFLWTGRYAIIPPSKHP
ncbi:MAG TPA: hypothetical protein VI336_00285, partial [Candidatus Saccharimonadales bacterium]|nr:hypothetical protein [Candidatus Saccharimonadales bacterium]